MKYKLINNYAVAVIRKNATTSIGKHAVEIYQPDAVDKVVFGTPNAHFNWIGLLPTVTEDDGHPSVALIRDPVDRFKSACLSENITVEEGLVKAESGEFHFKKQIDSISVDTQIYRYETDFDLFTELLGLPTPLPVENESTGDITLTSEQLTRFQEIYVDDIALYESITEAGQTYTPPPEPATDSLKGAKIRELESARYQAEVAGITLQDGKQILTDKETQAELGKALSVISTVNPSLEIDWKFPDGSIVSLDSAQIQQIAGAVFTHVQSTRTTYKDKIAEVEAATTKDELNAISW